MIVPTAVSRNTGAMASWMSRVTSARCDSGNTAGGLEPERSTVPDLDHGPAELVLEVMNMIEREFQLLAVLCSECLIALLLPFADFRLDRGLVDADHFMVGVHVDRQRLADGLEQVVLVQLRVALHGIVCNAGRDFAQFGKRLVLQFGE